MTTANKQYKYDTVYHEKSISLWVEDVHKYMSSKSRWKYFPLAPGLFGFDNQVLSIAYTFDNYKPGMDLDEVSNLVHEAWIINYKFWRDNEPWKKNKFYIKPSKKLGDERRNLCASLKYKDLPEDEQEKDGFIAEYLINKVFSKGINKNECVKISHPFETSYIEESEKKKTKKTVEKYNNNKLSFESCHQIQKAILLLSEIKNILKIDANVVALN